MSVRYLTVSPLRLNSRDYVRDRSANSHPDNALNLSSIRIEPSSDPYGSKSRQAGVSVTVHRSTTLNFARNKPGDDAEPDFEVPKLVRSLCLLATPRTILILPAGCRYLLFSRRRSNVEVERVGYGITREGIAGNLLTLLLALYPWSLLSHSYITTPKWGAALKCKPLLIRPFPRPCI